MECCDLIPLNQLLVDSVSNKTGFREFIASLPFDSLAELTLIQTLEEFFIDRNINSSNNELCIAPGTSGLIYDIKKKSYHSLDS